MHQYLVSEVCGPKSLTDEDGGELEADESHSQDGNSSPASPSKDLAAIPPNSQVQQAERCFGSKYDWRIEGVSDIVPLHAAHQQGYIMQDENNTYHQDMLHIGYGQSIDILSQTVHDFHVYGGGDANHG